MITGIVIAVVLALLVLWGIGTFNGLVKGRNGVQNAFRQIDVQLKRRIDLIPNLVESVKGAMKFERETLEAVVKARQQAVEVSGGPTGDVLAANAALSSATQKLFGLVENYPELKANSNTAQLMEELSSTENKIAFARQHYNDAATAQNDRIGQFPGNIVAGMFKFVAEPLWEVEAEERKALDKAAPSVSFA